jgi:hypothetical protein
VFANLVSPINCHIDAGYLEKNLLWQRAANFLCMCSSLLESVIVTEFQAVEAYSSVDLTKAKYIISRLPVMEKEDVIIQINSSNFIACEERKLI